MAKSLVWLNVQGSKAKAEVRKKSSNKNNSRNCGNEYKIIFNEVKGIITENI